MVPNFYIKIYLQKQVLRLIILKLVRYVKRETKDIHITTHFFYIISFLYIKMYISNVKNYYQSNT